MGEHSAVPPDLPALWAGLGDFARAECLFACLADAEKARALAGLAGSFADMGDPDRAERLVRSSSGRLRLSAYEKAAVWTDLAWSAAHAWEHERAGELLRLAYDEARSVDAPYRQAQLLLMWSRVRAAAADEERAGELADRALERASSGEDGPARHRWVLAALPVIVTGHRDGDRADRLVRTVSDPYQHARAAAASAVMLAAHGEGARAKALVGTITDEHRRWWVTGALAAIRRVGSPPENRGYRRARAVAGLGRLAAAGGAGHTGDPGDWAESLARHAPDRTDHAVIFSALAAVASGGGKARAASAAAAVADRAEAMVGTLPASATAPALVALAWMVADAGDPTSAIELALSVHALTRYPGSDPYEWRAPQPSSAAGTAGWFPELMGSPKQCRWAHSVRAAFVARRWGTAVPPMAMAELARLTEAHWWIKNREHLDGEFGDVTADLPAMTGTPRQRRTAEGMRREWLGERWPDGPPPDVAVALVELTDAAWWITHRDGLDEQLAEYAAAARSSELPEITGSLRARVSARKIRETFVFNRWNTRMPLAVRVVLNRLTDAGWWVRNEPGGSYAGNLDREFATLLPRDARTMMMGSRPGPVPEHGYSNEHEGPCKDHPDYQEMYELGFAVTAEHGDVRSAGADELRDDSHVRSCCGKAGWEAGSDDGEKEYLERAAEKLRRSRGLSEKKAREEAEAALATYKRALAGHG